MLDPSFAAFQPSELVFIELNESLSTGELAVTQDILKACSGSIIFDRHFVVRYVERDTVVDNRGAFKTIPLIDVHRFWKDLLNN